jgi:hypothetical protein
MMFAGDWRLARPSRADLGSLPVTQLQIRSRIIPC